MIATRRIQYAGRRVDVDAEFEASERDAKTLSTIGSARYATRAMTAGTLHLPPKKRGRPPKARA